MDADYDIVELCAVKVRRSRRLVYGSEEKVSQG